MEEDAVDKHLRENQEQIDKRNVAIDAQHNERKRREAAAYARVRPEPVACDHQKTVVIDVVPTEANGMALDGSVELRCANQSCNKLIEVLA